MIRPLFAAALGLISLSSGLCLAEMQQNKPQAKTQQHIGSALTSQQQEPPTEPTIDMRANKKLP